MKKGIFPNGIKPIAPYSPGVVYQNLLFISGQIAINPETSELVTDNIEKETHQVMKNLFQETLNKSHQYGFCVSQMKG